jgi:hypothetical protein
MESTATPSSGLLVLTCVHAAVSVLVAAVLVAAAMLVPAPAAVLPLVLLVGIGGPMVAAWELRPVVRHLRRSRSEATPLDADAVALLLRRLDQLPETPHPLGL